MKGNWHRYTFRQQCPICGHKGWCIYEGDVYSPEAVICARESRGCATRKDGSAIVARDGMGWLHRLRDNPNRRSQPTPTHQKSLPQSSPWMGDLADQCCRHAQERLESLAVKLGVSVRSLAVLRVGWCDRYTADGELVEVNAWTFPMRDRRRNVMGIRLRDEYGHKWSVRGGTNALFIPQGFPGNKRLCIVEGASDTAAMLDLGFDAIGRPSNTAGFDYLSDYCRFAGGHWKEICIIKNNDPIGTRARELTDGAANILAMHLAQGGKPVRVIAPPIGKDVRDWKNMHGAGRDDVEAFIRKAPLIRHGAPLAVAR